MACAAGLAVTKAILDRDLITAVASMGERLQAALISAFGLHPNVGDIIGRGLF